MRSRPVALVLMGLLATVVCGCTQSEAGQPRSGSTNEPTSESSAPSSPSASPAPSIPPRPEELSLTGVDPCTLFTEAQLDELQVDRTRKRTNGSQQFKGALECVLEVQKQQPFYHYSVSAITNEGIAPWLTGKRNVEARLTEIGGFAAATFWIRGAKGTNTDGCDTSVDVAEGQQLKVFTNNDGKHSFTLDQLCQRAEEAAALAVKTLQTLK